MEWTTEKPTQGWYWAYDPETVWPNDPNITGVELVYVRHNEGYLSCSSWDGQQVELEAFTHWQGPLDPPEPPK